MTAMTAMTAFTTLAALAFVFAVRDSPGDVGHGICSVQPTIGADQLQKNGCRSNFASL